MHVSAAYCGAQSSGFSMCQSDTEAGNKAREQLLPIRVNNNNKRTNLLLLLMRFLFFHKANVKVVQPTLQEQILAIAFKGKSWSPGSYVSRETSNLMLFSQKTNFPLRLTTNEWWQTGVGGGRSLASLLEKESHETPQGDAVGSIGQCIALMATLTEKFLIGIIGGADFMKQLLSVQSKSELLHLEMDGCRFCNHTVLFILKLHFQLLIQGYQPWWLRMFLW